jgi:transmembrane sensor
MQMTETADAAARFDRACQWFIDLRESPQSPELVAGWLEWCRADERNRAAFERAREVWQGTASVRADSFDIAPTVTPVAASQAHLPGAAGARRRRGAWPVPVALAASVLAVTALLYQLRPAVFAPTPAGVLATESGENRTVRLADGSTVALGAGSKLATHFDGQARRLTLERGEAYFRVEPDRNRPFVVNVGELRVTALGTAFNVRTAGERVVVSVSEGLVAVDPPGGLSAEPLRAAAGEEVVIDTGARKLQLSRVAPDTVASWQSGRLEFTREPLRAVLVSVNRYSPRPVELSDPKLGELRFTGTVFADRVEDWVRALPQVFPVSVREEQAAVVISGIPD